MAASRGSPLPVQPLPRLARLNPAAASDAPVFPPGAARLPMTPALLDLFAHTGDAVVVVDAYLRVVLVNAAAQRLLGDQALAWLGDPCYQAFNCGAEAGGRCHILDRLQAGQPIARHTLPARLSDDDWTPVTISTIVVPIAGAAGPYLVHIFQPIDVPAAQPATARARIWCLGQFRIALADAAGTTDIAWGRKKVRDVFKYLVAHRQRWVMRDELLDVFWPDLPPTQAAHNLRVTLSSLRKALDAAGAAGWLVETRDTLVRLADGPRVWVDAGDFAAAVRLALAQPTPLDDAALARLEAAVGLYGDDFLVEDRYEDWTLDERQHLIELHQAALRLLAREYSARGRVEPALQCLRDVVRRNAADEEAQRLLMLALARAGRRPAAMQQYHELAALLDRELGVAPAPETVALARQIQAGTPL